MEYHLTTTKLVGKVTNKDWSNVHEYCPPDSEKLEKRGRLYATFTIKGIKEGIDIVESGHELILRLHEQYFGDLEGSAYNALDAAVSKLVKEFEGIVGEKLEISILTFVKGVIYVSSYGGGEVVLFREGGYSKIIKSVSSVVSASGYPGNKDVILLTSADFFKVINEGVVKPAILSGDIESAFESFYPSLLTEEAPAVSAIAILFGEGGPGNGDIGKIIEDKKSSSEINRKTNTQDRLVSFIDRALQKIPKGKIYVKERIVDMGGVKRIRINKFIYIGLILISLLVISVVFGVKQNDIKERSSKFEEEYSKAKENLEKSLQIFDLSPQQSRQYFNEAKSSIDRIKSLGIEDKRLAEIEKQLSLSEGKILGELNVSVNPYLDLALYRSGYKVGDIDFWEGQIAVLDKDTPRSVSIEILTKETKVVEGSDDVKNGKQIALYGGKYYVLNNEGIFELGASPKTAINKEWEGDVLIRTFAANIYLLDKSQDKIYRYAGAGGGFGSRQDWLSKESAVDFSEVRIMRIDGSIWLVESLNKIMKFTRGVRENFVLSEAPDQLIEVTSFYTDSDSENLYFLEKGRGRILVFDKEGVFKIQYKADSLKDANNMVVSEKEKKIILLLGEDKLYSIDLVE